MIRNILIFTLIVAFTSSASYSQQTLVDSLAENELLLYTTVKLNVTIVNPKTKAIEKGSGTSFFFDFSNDSNYSRTYLVTNKHVIKNSIEGTFHITKQSSDGFPDSTVHKIQLDKFESRWIPHPDSTVDLCIMPIAELGTEAYRNGINLFYVVMPSYLIPTRKEWENFAALEPIKMVGYPIGISDTYNNLPLTRQGISATPVFKNYNGKREFIMDVAAFPGSSGSPVFILDKGYKRSKNGKRTYEVRRHLVGILYGGPTLTKTQQVIFQKTAINIKAFAQQQSYLNLGYAINSRCLFDFLEIINQKN